MPRDEQSREFMPVSERVILRGGSRYGLVIGIDKYKERGLDLRYAAADARAMYDLMVDETCGCFPRENVTLLLNEEATTHDVGKALSGLTRKIGPNDTVWIYFAGHGAVEGDEAYWVAHDSDVHHLSMTGLDKTRINKELSKLRSERVLLLLDCCHAAATALQTNALRAIPSMDDLFGRFEGKGIMTLAASDGKQKSVELSELGRGAFTYYLEKGLRGEADEKGDGVVTLNNLWRYLCKKVEAEAQRANNKQTPVKHGMMTGDDMPLTVNAAVVGRIPRLTATIKGMVGIRAGQLREEQAYYCIDLLHRTSLADKEQDVLDALEEVDRGELQAKRFIPIVELAMRALRSKEEIPTAPAPKEEIPTALALTIIQKNAPKSSIESSSITFLEEPTTVDETAPKSWGDRFGTDSFGYFTEFAIGKVVQRMRWIPRGTFMMGSPLNEQARYHNEVQHRVMLTKGFWLGETTVTQTLWQTVMGHHSSNSKGPDCPIVKVSWRDCERFAARINHFVRGGGFRLPTEAEWEYACRAGTTTATFAGDMMIDAVLKLESIGWYQGNSGGTIQPVGQKAANPWGLYDMLGNVYEWCSDWFAPYDVNVDDDPRGPAMGDRRILRGGSWCSRASSLRAANRIAYPSGISSQSIGFRLARGPVAG